jgi:SAM-dependent methyltransferase
MRAVDTRSDAYAARLERLSDARWRRWLDVQAPYRRRLRRLGLGRTLDLGCGIGRHLLHLPPGSVGVDPSRAAVEAARRRGGEAYLPEEFRASPRAGERFDALLCAHVLEHMRFAAGEALLAEWLPSVRSGGQVVLVTPQEAGFRSDPTHVEFQDLTTLVRMLARLGCSVERAFSFPFPSFVGRYFRHNESIAVGRVP